MVVMELKSENRRIKFMRFVRYLAILSMIFAGLNTIPENKFILPFNRDTPGYSRENTNHIQFQKNIPSISAPGENETVAPIVSILIPAQNNTLVFSTFFSVTANITDENPPLPGNVSIEISNITTSLFNASMTFTITNVWTFHWVNITTYANGETYILRVRALDSSLNRNVGISTDLYIILDIPTSNTPKVWNVILYITVVGALIALIIVFLSRKQAQTKPQKQRLRS
jgi:hypothetical protein